MASLNQQRFEIHRRGPSLGARLFFFVVLSIIFLNTDSPSNQFLGALRSGVSLVIRPAQEILLMPKATIEQGKDYVTDVRELNQIKSNLTAKVNVLGPLAQRTQLLEQENRRLQESLKLYQQSPYKLIPSTVLYEARNPVVRKLIIDKGSLSEVKQGAPVIDTYGVVGQITRVKPTESELTLLIDSNQPIPIAVARNGIRGIAYGSSQFGYIELRFMPLHADIQVGDVLVTSGLDGVYPSGLSVARVSHVDKKSDPSFLKVYAQPTGALLGVKHIFVVDYKPSPSQLRDEMKHENNTAAHPQNEGDLNGETGDSSSASTTTAP